MENQKKSNYALQSVDKALQILTLFSEEEPEFTLTEIGRRMGMSNPVALKYLNTLEQRGFLTRDRKTKKYSLGLTIISLGGIVRRNNVVNQAAFPIMKQLAETVGESVYLQVPLLPEYEAVVVGVIETEKNITSRFLGSCKLYAGASRKVLLAYLGDDYLNRLLDQVKIEPYTEETNIDPESLKKEMEEIRNQGYAISYGETIEGACGIAAPIFGIDGIAASLMIYIPIYRLEEQMVASYLEQLLSATRQITRNLGGTADESIDPQTA